MIQATSRYWEKVRSFALSLPETHEQICHGTPACYTGKKFFTRIQENGETLVVYNDDRDAWIESDPDLFFYTDHYKNYPILLIHLPGVSMKSLKELLVISWKLRTSKKLLKLHQDL
ncbi:MAG TPA: hypothetical protein PLC48_05885 [Ferruginibacter sp.]|nr:hypothetical protein [Ferruginibacter sp.]